LQSRSVEFAVACALALKLKGSNGSIVMELVRAEEAANAKDENVPGVRKLFRNGASSLQVMLAA
jgi:hypothetical protein